MKPVPKFGFYEMVKVQTPDPKKSHLNGEIGAVLGRTDTEDHPDPYLYGVSIDSLGRVWAFFESELEPTGQWARREDYYDGSSVRVQVDERGRGTVVPTEDKEADA